ncbi:hypothetical protein [Methylobacterium sp. D54C]
MASDGFPYPVNTTGNFAAEQPSDEMLKPFGYAPGAYDMRCSCGNIAFNIDKRAIRCRSCAVAAYRDKQVVSAAQSQRMQTVTGQDEAKRALLLDLSRSVAAAAQDGLHFEHIVSVLVRLLAQEERLLESQRANERSY